MTSTTKETLIKNLMPATVRVNLSMSDYRMHPYFIKKHNDALSFLKKAGVPDISLIDRPEQKK